MSLSLPPSHADPESWALVAPFKAASSYVGDVLGELLGARGVPHIDLAGYAFAHDQVEREFCIENQALLREPGYYFGPFRDVYIAEMRSLRDLNVIAHIRDPRDCLVSYHYSVAFSHAIPESGPARDTLLADRRLYGGRTVDQSVLADCNQFQRIFEGVRDLCEGNSSALVSRYEDMVTDFATWLERLSAFARCAHLTEVKTAIKQRARSSVEENHLNHIRQIIPGDFRRKLALDTQRILTERLHPVLSYFSYSCEP